MSVRERTRAVVTRAWHWLRSVRRLPYLVSVILALRVIWWLPLGSSPDGSNSYSPLMPILISPLSSAQPWNPLLENGFPNPQIPRFLESLPLYGFSYAGLDTWEAQVAWLFLLYAVGAALAIRAAISLIPNFRDRWWALVIVGVAYQLTPSLMFNLQDSAAFGLPIATYWGLPLLTIAVLEGPRWNRMLSSLLVGVGCLLVLTEFPATLIPLLVFGCFLVLVLLLRNPGWRGLRRIAPFALLSSVWIALTNLWWLVPEFQYRADLLSNLAINVPLTSAYPNHLANLLFLNWAWPSPTTYLSYTAGFLSMFACLAILVVTVCGINGVRALRGGLTIFTTWLFTFVLVYGSSSPLNQVYQSVFQASVFSYLIRNSSHFAPLFDLLTVVLFAVGAVWIGEDVVPFVARVVKSRPRLSRRRSGARVMEGPVHPVSARVWISRGVLACAACGLLVVASYPLVNGDVLENVNFNGTQISPVQPLERGVQVPSYYYQARSWLAKYYPGDTTMVFPMPDTWLSADSNLSWGYEGTSAIYSTLLSEPLISNDAGTLTAPSFPAISDTYSIAAAGGPPGSPTGLPMNSSTYLWPGYANDSVTYSGPTGPGSTGELNWTVYLGHDYGTNGHQFRWNIDERLPANSTYLGLWVRVNSPGTLLLSWGLNNSLEGWYTLATTPDSWAYVVIPMGTPPPINYIPGSLPLTEFPNATSVTFQFQPTGPLKDSDGSIQLAGFAVYPSDPNGLPFYLESLGARLIVVDSSIVAAPSDPLQNLSTYGVLLKTISGWLVAQFGNLSVYEVPDSLSTLSSAGSLGEAPNYYLAWVDRSSGSDYFGVDLPSWVERDRTGTVLNVEETSPSSYDVSVKTSSPFVLALLQNFNPLWVVDIGGQTLDSQFEIDGFGNAWQINTTGNYSFSVIFLPDRSYSILVVASPLVGAGLLVLAIPTIWSRLKARGNRLLATFRRPGASGP